MNIHQDTNVKNLKEGLRNGVIFLIILSGFYWTVVVIEFFRWIGL